MGKRKLKRSVEGFLQEPEVKKNAFKIMLENQKQLNYVEKQNAIVKKQPRNAFEVLMNSARNLHSQKLPCTCKKETLNCDSDDESSDSDQESGIKDNDSDSDASNESDSDEDKDMRAEEEEREMYSTIGTFPTGDEWKWKEYIPSTVHVSTVLANPCQYPSHETSSSAYLTKLIIYRKYGYRNHILDFCCVYSDYTKSNYGNIKIADETIFDLKHGEHIISLGIRKGYGRPGHLLDIKIETSFGKVFETGRRCYDQIFTAPEGHALFNLLYDCEKCTFKGFETRAISAFKSVLPLSSPFTSKVPPLLLLAKDAISIGLNNEASDLATIYQDRLESIGKSIKAMVRKAYSDGLANVRKSCQYKKVLQLKKEIAAAEGELLDFKFTEVYKAHDIKNRLVTKYSLAKEELINEQRTQENEIANLHQSVANQVSLLMGQSVNVCCVRKCRSLFQPGTQLKHCHVEDCCSRQHQCGCTLKKCLICDVLACNEHFESHYMKCSRNSPNVCGWCGDEGVVWPEMCGKILEKDSLCWYCGTNCCSDCLDSCDHCRRKWCKRCQKVSHMPAECCCNHSQFHEEHWVRWGW